MYIKCYKFYFYLVKNLKVNVTQKDEKKLFRVSSRFLMTNEHIKPYFSGMRASIYSPKERVTLEWAIIYNLQDNQGFLNKKQVNPYTRMQVTFQ